MKMKKITIRREDKESSLRKEGNRKQPCKKGKFKDQIVQSLIISVVDNPLKKAMCFILNGSLYFSYLLIVQCELILVIVKLLVNS